MLFVISPFYNSSKYIGSYFDCVLKNDLKDVLLILVNDGSKDDTLDRLKEYKKRYSSLIHIIDTPNNGPAVARNIALDYVYNRKEDGYILFIDSDDKVAPDYFKRMIEISNRDSSDVVLSSFYYSSKNNDHLHLSTKENKDEVISGYEATKLILEDTRIYSFSHGKLFKKKCLENIRYPKDVVFLEDAATIYKALLKSDWVSITAYAGYYYTQDNNESVMRKKITNSFILSGWRGLTYILSDENIRKDKELYKRSKSLFMDNVLELYPRFDKKSKEEWKIGKRYISNAIKHLYVLSYRPRNKNCKIKKIMFFLFPHFYHFLFNIYLKK